MKQRYLVFDYETYSEVDIKKAGAYEYAVHPSTEILCVAYRLGTKETLKANRSELVKRVDYRRKAIDIEFVRALKDPNVKLVAHNAMFERLITRHVLSRTSNLIGADDVISIDPKRWICTAAQARACGLPGSLDGCSSALKLPHTKDKKGHAVMLKLSKPRNPSAKDLRTRITENDAPHDFERLYEYCLSDIAAEVDVFLTLPSLTERETDFWLLDQEINLRGFAVDRRLVKGALSCIKRITKEYDAQVDRLTGGVVSSARQGVALRDYISQFGTYLKNMRKATVDAALESFEISEEARALLELRQAASKSSTAKYVAFERRSRSDGRVRDTTIFHGAHTGRQAGSGLQPQNLFKSVIDKKDIAPAIEIISNRDVTALEALFDRPMEALASVLRGAIVAADGHTLDVADFNAIEVRVLFWLAGHTKGIEALRSGRDLYLDMASVIYGTDLSELTAAYVAGLEEGVKGRNLGKQVVLGAGFGIGIGGHKFQASAKQYGMDISLSLASKAIRAYRKLHAPVPRFWDTIEAAAIKAMNNPGTSYRHGYLTWRREGRWLTCELPIGRKLRYFRPRLEMIQSKAGANLTLTYMGVDSVSRKFKRTSTWGGKLTENVVQAVARDLLYEALYRLHRKGHSTVLAIHDEVVCERDTWWGSKEEMQAIMERVPKWAPGLPMKVEGYSEPRYRK